MKTENSPAPPELHRPYVDDVKLHCPTDGCSGQWFVAYVLAVGSIQVASFAQWHYPFENKEVFDGAFPVDYICEGVIKLEAGSLYSQYSAVFDSICYRRCLSLGHILDKMVRR